MPLLTELTQIVGVVPLLKGLAEALNFIHVPAPAFRFAPHVAWYGVYF